MEYVLKTNKKLIELKFHVLTHKKRLLSKDHEVEDE